MEQMAALSLAACGRERHQLGDAVSSEELAYALQSRIQPHQNRGVIKNRDTEIRMEIQSVLAKGSAEATPPIYIRFCNGCKKADSPAKGRVCSFAEPRIGS